MAKEKEKKKKSDEKEEVSEIIWVDKNKDGKMDKGEEIKSHGTIPVEHASEKKKKEYNKIIRNVVLLIGLLILVLVAVLYFGKASTSFNYNGIDVKMQREGDLLLYRIQVPVIFQGEPRPYNFYLRNDPRNLDDIPFEGEVRFRDTLVINTTEDFKCGGYGLIAVKNIVTLYELVPTKVIKDLNASCDTGEQYTHINIEEGEKTEVIETSKGCYKIKIKDCEILEGTEKFMVETFIKLDSRHAV